MHDLAAHVQEVDGPVSEHWRKQRVALERALGVVGDEPGTRSSGALLILESRKSRQPTTVESSRGGGPNIGDATSTPGGAYSS